MHVSKWSESKQAKRILFFLLLAIGILVRMIYLGSLPAGVDQDEAMAGYLAYTTYTEGVDITGYHNPIYFEAWGNGMNALEIYLMIPLFQLFGMSDLTLRLPQAIIACATLPVFYLILKRIFDEKTAMIGLFLLAINPWHIMMSRWALESNLAPAFLFFGLYAFILALEKHPAYYLLSALMYGLSLYTYAILWLVVPIILVLQILYALLMKRARITRYTVGFVVLLGLIASPLLVLNVVNHYWIPEIKTAWFSIPKLGAWRSGDIKLGNLFGLNTISNLWNMLFKQSDTGIRSSFPAYGLYYMFSLPIILLGIVETVQDWIQSVREKRFELKTFALIQLIAALIICLLINTINVNRSNCLHLPLILFCAVGLSKLTTLSWKAIPHTILALYCISFLAFTGYYFGHGQFDLSTHYRPGTKEAIYWAQENTDEPIVCRMHAKYSKVLYYNRMSLEDYHNTVVYESPYYPDPTAFGQFVFEFVHTESISAPVYITEDDEAKRYEDAGYIIEPFDRMVVAYLPGHVDAD